MRIFWWQHGLHLKPESQEEANMLVALVDNTRFTDKHESLVKKVLKVGVGDIKAIPEGEPRRDAKNENRFGGTYQTIQDESL